MEHNPVPHIRVSSSAGCAGESLYRRDDEPRLYPEGIFFLQNVFFKAERGPSLDGVIDELMNWLHGNLWSRQPRQKRVETVFNALI